jgi:hypothetical protein
MNTPIPFEIKIRIVKFSDNDRHPMICIDSDQFSYSRIIGMYTAGDGEGMQVEQEVDEEAALEVCRRIAMTIRKYYIEAGPKDITLKAPLTFFDEDEIQ